MQINSYVILVFVLDAIILLTIFATRKKMGSRVAITVLTALMLAFFALAFFGLSLLITDEKLRFTLHELKFIPLASIAPCSLVLYCEFTGHPLKRRTANLLFVIPTLTTIAVLTNDYHHIFRDGLYIIYHNGFSYVGTDSSWGYWIFSIYSYIIYVVGIIILTVNYYKMPRIYRDQIGFMVSTAMIAVLIGLVLTTGRLPDYGDITLVTCGIVVIVQYITIVNYSHRRVKLKAWNLIIDNLDVIVMIFDHNDRLVDSSKDASALSGIINSGPAYLSDPNGSIDGSIVRLPDNKYFSISEKRLYDEKERYTGRVLVIRDVSAVENAVNELEYISTHDYLTGLENRLAFHRRLQSLTEESLPTALVCLNILGMKLMNNIYGNEYGDRVILRVTKEIETIMGKETPCMRLGGDEFGVILKNTDKEQAEELVNKLKASLKRYDTTIGITLETGFVIITNTEQNAEQLFADIAGTMHKTGGVKARTVSQGFMDSLNNSLIHLYDASGARTQKITALCMSVAEKLKLTDEEKQNLELLSVMVDVGLLSVSPALLKNRGDLSNDQWNEWKLHPVKGHNIALSIQQLTVIAREILSHHERYDGYGFPMRLKGDKIPYLARIVSAVEFFVDAPHTKARDLLKARAGTQFDPQVAEALLAVCDEPA